VNWIPNLSATGAGTTLSIDGLPAVAVKLPDGVSDPGAVDLAAGKLYQLWYDGTRFRLLSETNPIATGVAQTRANAQSGQSLLCQSNSTSGTAYTCDMNPVLSAYQTGMVLNWIPDVSASGPSTLAINDLTAQAVKLPDGVTDPGAVDLAAGKLYQLWYDGTRFRLLSESDPVATGVAQTRANAQSGQSLLCQSNSASDTVYTCNMAPELAAYQTGMVLNWIPDVSASGTATLAISGLAAIPIKLADGINSPVQGDIPGGLQQQLWYDGTVFRLPKGREGVSLGSVRPTCAVTLAGRIWYLVNGTGTKDDVAVCAKDASDQYDWRIIY
jgi:hypothetical protein